MTLLTLSDFMTAVAAEGIEGEIPTFPSSPDEQLSLLMPYIGRPLSSIPKWMILGLTADTDDAYTVSNLSERIAHEPLWIPEGEEEFL